MCILAEEEFQEQEEDEDPVGEAKYLVFSQCLKKLFNDVSSIVGLFGDHHAHFLAWRLAFGSGVSKPSRLCQRIFLWAKATIM